MPVLAYSSFWTVSDMKGLGMSDAFLCPVHVFAEPLLLIFRYCEPAFLLVSPELTCTVKGVTFTRVEDPTASRLLKKLLTHPLFLKI